MSSRLAALALLLSGCASGGGDGTSSASRGPSAPELCAEGQRQAGAGRLAEAEAAYSRALAVDPGLAQACFERGRIRLKLGNPAGAREDLTRWLEYDPKYTLVRADLDLALFEDARGPRRDAAEAAGQRAEDAGARLSAFRKYAEAYALTIEPEAEERLTEALIRTWVAARPRPGYPPELKRYLAQAQLYAQRGSHEEAGVAYWQAARFCPWCAEAHYNQAVIMGEYRQYGRSAAAMKRALALLPEGPETSEANGLLFTWETLGE